MSLTVKTIAITSANFYGVSLTDILSRRRDKPSVLARQVTMWLAHKLSESNISDIGRALGDRDPSTVRYGVNRIAEARNFNVKLRGDLIKLEKSLSKGAVS